MEQQGKTLEEARQELLSLLKQISLTPYSSLTFEEAKELISRVRSSTQIRTKRYLTASPIKKRQGIGVRANIDGKPFSFRNINEFVCYFNSLVARSNSPNIKGIREFNVKDKSYPIPTW